MENEVDPRFARWFGRQVVLHARLEEELFVQKATQKETEKWIQRKAVIKHCPCVIAYLLVSILKLLTNIVYCFVVAFSFFSTVGVFIAGILLIGLFISHLCPYRIATDTCMARSHFRHDNAELAHMLDNILYVVASRFSNVSFFERVCTIDK